MSAHHTEIILTLARSNRLLRTRDVDSAGAPRAVLAHLTHDGRLVRVVRGLYALPDRTQSEHDSLAEVSAKSSTGVICLISALRFHELTTQQSSDIWLVIPHKAHTPRMDYPPLRIVRMSGEAMARGIDEVDVAGTTVRGIPIFHPLRLIDDRADSQQDLRPVSDELPAVQADRFLEAATAASGR